MAIRLFQSGKLKQKTKLQKWIYSSEACQRMQLCQESQIVFVSHFLFIEPAMKHSMCWKQSSCHHQLSQRWLLNPFSWTSYILFLASTSKYVLAAPDQCLSNMVHGVLFQLLDSCLWDRYQQHLRPWNTGRRQAGLHRDHVDGSMSALHLQEALVGEIWIGHCHLPLQQLFAALGQGGRSSQNCSSLMWQEESRTHLLLSLANLECLHIFLAWKKIFFLVNAKRKSRKV